MKLPAKDATGIHEMDEHVTLEWFDGGQVVSLVLKNVSRKAIDTWYEVIKLVAQSWQEEQVFLAMYDLSAISLTPYFRKRGKDVAEVVRHLHGRYAVIIADDVMSGPMRLFFQLDVRQQSSRTGQVFSNQEAALGWLEELLP